MGLSDLLPSESSTPSVRKPNFSIGFAGGASAAGGLLASVGLPTEASDDPWASVLVAANIHTALAPAVAYAELWLAEQDNTPALAQGDSGDIGFGYDGDSNTVFSGDVDSITHRLDGLRRIVVTGSAMKLASLRINQSYEQQAAGDIVTDLINQAGATAGSIDAGINSAFFVVDDRQSAWRIIDQLALQSGCIAYVDAEDQVHFVPLKEQTPVASFQYGQSIMAATLQQRSQSIDQLTVIGESAAGSQGADAAHWLIKDPAAVTASSGSGDKQGLVSRPSLKTAESVQSLADAQLNRLATAAATGSIDVPGNAAVYSGAFIEITGAPSDELNGIFLVTALRHHYSKSGGFITRCQLAKFTEAAGGIAGLLGGLL